MASSCTLWGWGRNEGRPPFCMPPCFSPTRRMLWDGLAGVPCGARQYCSSVVRCRRGCSPSGFRRRCDPDAQPDVQFAACRCVNRAKTSQPGTGILEAEQALRQAHPRHNHSRDKAKSGDGVSGTHRGVGNQQRDLSMRDDARRSTPHPG